MIEAGAPAPEFTLPDQEGEDVSLAGFRGQPVVLYFYPKAEPRWKATANVVVAGKPVKAGETFAAPPEQVADAVARRLVEAAPKATRKRS